VAQGFAGNASLVTGRTIGLDCSQENNMRSVAVVSVAMWAASVALAGFTVPQQAGPINSNGAAGDAGNGIFTFDYAGAQFIPGQLTFSGLLTSGGVNSYPSEARWKITNPAGQVGLFQPTTTSGAWSGTLAIGPVNAADLENIFTGNNVGTWTFEAYESYDDSGLDAWWNDVNFSFASFVAPYWSESFETSVPPAGWTEVSTPGHTQAAQTTWFQTTTSYAHGLASAQCNYDYNQDEWLYSDNITAVSNMTLTGKTMGSIYWGTPPSQGGTYDNYDVQAWIIRGGTYGGGDDVMIAKLDDNWVMTWVWADFSYNLDPLLTLGETFQLGFRYVGDDGAQGNIDGLALTPEPASLVLLALAGLALRRR
jgi:hypothetical protein